MAKTEEAKLIMAGKIPAKRYASVNELLDVWFPVPVKKIISPGFASEIDSVIIYFMLKRIRWN